MKKVGLVLLLSLVLVLAMASTALASTYVSWTDPVVEAANLSAGAPHGNYQTSTVKCAVCHSVHSAPVSFTDSAGTPNVNTELLLRSNVADACVYCHISTDIGGVQLYGGVPTNWNVPGATDPETGHSMGAGGFNPTEGGSCTKCHSVHGANTLQGEVADKILLKGTSYKNEAWYGANSDGLPYTTANIENGYMANRDFQITGFCSKCHMKYTTASEILSTTTRRSHPMKTPDTTFDNTGAGGSYNGQVAWTASTYCRSCHAAGVDGSTTNVGPQPNDFPHYSANNKRFLTNNTNTDVTDASQDGVCLRCHASGTSGVGQTF